jgi:putative transcriptional regulator
VFPFVRTGTKSCFFSMGSGPCASRNGSPCEDVGQSGLVRRGQLPACDKKGLRPLKSSTFTAQVPRLKFVPDMLLNLERLDLLIAHYVAGCLPEPAHILVGSHLEMQPSSARLASGLDRLAGDALDATVPLALPSRDERLKAIFASHPRTYTPSLTADHRDPQLPRFLNAYAGRKLDDVPWKMKLPGLRQHVIEKSSGMEASLVWARPGRALPHHRHRGLELTLVLQGGFEDNRGAFGQGDVSVADETIAHRPVATSDSSCLCFSVLLAPIALSGPTFRIFADILGL